MQEKASSAHFYRYLSMLHAFLMPLCLFNAIRTHLWPAGPCFIVRAVVTTALITRPPPGSEKQEKPGKEEVLIASLILNDRLSFQSFWVAVRKGRGFIDCMVHQSVLTS